jgi:hypothetical protein
MEQLALNEGEEYMRTLLRTYVFKLSRTYIFTTVNSSKGIQENEANTTSTCFLNLMILVSQQTYNRILRSEPN